MKAIQVRSPGGLDKLETVEMDDPGAPGVGEIRVRIHASSLNFHDYIVASGGAASEDGRIPMSDGAGVVEAVGDGVTEFAEGDHVVSVFFPNWMDGPPRVGDFTHTPGDGVDGYAREVVVRPSYWFTRSPAGWRHEEAATITTAGLTAWRALVVDGGLASGSDVLVLGSGGVSIYALQIARAMGARVFATSSSEEKLQRLTDMGATGVVNYKTTPDWGAEITRMTEGRGVDHVIEVGGAGTLAQSINASRIGGHVAMIGVLAGLSADVPTGNILHRQLRVQGLIVGSRAMQCDMIRAMEVTGIRPVIDRTFALDELADAFKHEKDGKHFGKIALSI